MQSKINNKDFFKSLISTALPIALQQLLTSSLSIVDILMISTLKEKAVASVSISNQLFFIFTLLCFAFGSGSSIFISQYWGKKDVINIRRIIILGLSLGLLISFLFTFIALFIPDIFISLYNKDKDIIIYGSSYLKIVSSSFIFTAFSVIIQSALRTVGQARLILIISICVLSINSFLNYILIFGHFNFPALGVNGAAIATLIARIIEFIFTLYMLFSKKLNPFFASLKEYLYFDLSLFKRYTLKIIPLVLNELLWGLGMMMYNNTFSKMSTNIAAAYASYDVLMNMSFTIFMGISHACAIIIGNKIGAGLEEEAFLYAKKYLLMTFATSFILSIIIYFNIDNIISIYKHNYEKETILHLKKFLKAFVFLFTLKALTMNLVLGIFRGGGDTHFFMILEFITLWGIGIPVLIYTGLFLKLDVFWVYILASQEETIKFIFSMPRFFSKKWIHDLTNI